MTEGKPGVWQKAMHEALIAMNAAVRAYQHLLDVVPFKAGGSPFAEINIRYETKDQAND